MYGRYDDVLTKGHVEYVLENVMNWERGWGFDKRSMKQIARACNRYDNNWSAMDYYRIIREYNLLEKPTKYSNYRY